MPARVEAVIAERVGRLSRPLRALLRAASVEGEEFTAEVLARVQGLDEGRVFQSLNSELDRRHRLIRTQSIQRINGQLLSRYRFRHILIQKYLYGSLNAVECVHLHEQVGLALEQLFRPSEQILSEVAVAPQLARHFQEAKNKDKAIHYLKIAGERALQLSAYQEAFVHLTKGLELLMTESASLVRAEREFPLQFSLSITLKGLKSNASPETEKALMPFKHRR
jgi:predicted ATPase